MGGASIGWVVSNADLGEKAAPERHGGRRQELLRSLCVHVLALIVYGVLVLAVVWVANWDPFGSNSGWSTLAIVVAGWLWLAGGTLWLVRLVNLTRCSLQGRQGLARRTLAFDSLLWLGPGLILLLP
jgi:hypothetical protein